MDISLSCPCHPGLHGRKNENQTKRIITLRPATRRSRPKRAALDALDGYLASHAYHLNYAARLADGRSIGSGQVEGACKNMIGRRLKQTGARWRVRRVNRMASLCSLLYSNH
jgi:hypothetical protein